MEIIKLPQQNEINLSVSMSKYEFESFCQQVNDLLFFSGAMAEKYQNIYTLKNRMLEAVRCTNDYTNDEG